MEENCGFGICWPNAYFKVVAITLSHDCELVGFSSLGENISYQIFKDLPIF